MPELILSLIHMVDIDTSHFTARVALPAEETLQYCTNIT